MDAFAPAALNILTWSGVFLAAYLVGAIPTAYLAGRWLKGQDLRRCGDGNAGAANLARLAGTRAGLMVGAIDIGKGAAAVLLARWLLDAPAAGMAAGVLTIIGHTWPVYLRGHGGRGAATAVGVLLAVVPLVAVPIAVPALAVLSLTGSATRALAVYYIPIPFLALWPAGYPYPLAAYSLAIPLLVGFSHYLSLRRAPV
jgi:acyl phosphate:glycerol-3-phosphate acyltransferase